MVLSVKPLSRQIGFDDGHFFKGEDLTPIVGTVVRGSDLVEGFLFDGISVDGDDSTEVIRNLVLNSKFYDTLKVLFFKGVTLGGFNVVDIKELSKDLDLPVIVVLRKLPDMEKIKRAIEHTDNPKEKLERMKSAGRIYEMPRPRGKLFFQKAGVNKREARELIEFSIKTGNIPESLRISHLIASAITLGESRRRA